jgi:transposase
MIQGKSDLKSVLYIDGWRSYDGLVDPGLDKHFASTTPTTSSRGERIIFNRIESFWSFAKQRLLKFNGIQNIPCTSTSKRQSFASINAK